MKPFKKHYKPNALELLNAKAVPIKSMQDHNVDEIAVPGALKQLENEAKEVTLLRHQLANTPQDVNTFLLNKYTDGTSFALAEKNKYDNSDERKRVGISFTYHVFYPEDPQNTLERANNKYVITDKILDTETGDEYFYHFPIRKCLYKQLPYYQIDVFNELINTDGTTAGIPTDYPGGGNRIFHSLQTLAAQLRVGVPNLPRDVYKCLVENEFMSTSGKLDLAVKTGVMVEKYFLKFDSMDRKPHGIRYLERQFKAPPAAVPAVAPTAVPTEVPPTTESVDEPPIADLDTIPPQEEGKVTVWSSFGKKLKARKTLPLPTEDDDLETVIAKLEKRGVKVVHLTGRSDTKANIDDAKYPVPLCFGKVGVLLVHIRPLTMGMTGKQYREQAAMLYQSWLTSFSDTSMSSKIPTGKMKDLVVRDFGNKILEDAANVSIEELLATKRYSVKTKKESE